MKTLVFDELNGDISVVNLKFPPDWDLMDDEQQARFVRIVMNNEEPDNIIAFRRPDFVDLTRCF